MLARISSALLATPRVHNPVSISLPIRNHVRSLCVISKADHDKLIERLETTDAKYKLALADMENLRQSSQKRIEETRQYAITNFCKDLLDVTDTFEMAMKHITPESVGKSNYDGIRMIEQSLLAIFKKNGLISLNPHGLKYNPNEHQALYEVPDANKEPGTVSEVCKLGWKLKDRLVRPAVVGVSKRPDT